MNSIMMSEYNNQVNKRLQNDNDPIDETRALLHFLMSLNKNMEQIHHKLLQTQIDVDMYLTELSTGTITLQGATTPGGFRGPIKLSDVIATWALNSPVAADSSGFVTGPGALATITSVVLQPGTYTANWIVGFGAGAVAAADANNFRLFGIPVPQQAVIPAVANTTVPQTPVTFTITSQTTIGIQSIGAGTGTANYAAELSITGQTTVQTVTLQIKERSMQLTPSTGTFQIVGMSGNMLITERDKIILTVTPAAACFLEVMGSADYRKIDRQET